MRRSRRPASRTTSNWSARRSSTTTASPGTTDPDLTSATRRRGTPTYSPWRPTTTYKSGLFVEVAGDEAVARHRAKTASSASCGGSIPRSTSSSSTGATSSAWPSDSTCRLPLHGAPARRQAPCRRCFPVGGEWPGASSCSPARSPATTTAGRRAARRLRSHSSVVVLAASSARALAIPHGIERDPAHRIRRRPRRVSSGS